MIELKGVEQLLKLSKDLKAAGDKGLNRELSKGISQAMRPAMQAARNSALQTLPARGGLARRVAGSSMRTIRRAGPRSAGIRLQAKNAYGLGRLDRGLNRHPVYGNMRVWVTQKVTPGWWTAPTQAVAPETQKQLEAAMQTVANKI